MKSKTWIRSLVFLQSNQLKKTIVRILRLKTFPIVLLPIATTSAFAAPVRPSLIIPDGSYLDNTALIGIVFFNGDLNYYRHGDRAVIFKNGAAMRCWHDGHDITYTPSTATFACDTSINRHPDNIAESLYSLLVPYGRYLEHCAGVLRRRINGVDYLYTSCSTVEGGRVDHILDITHCLPPEKELVRTDDGNLSCVTSTVDRRTHSYYLPPGNYLASCTKMSFDPCAEQGQGKLTASCLTPHFRSFTDAELVNADSVCRMDNLGLVSNVNGQLACDPSVGTFSTNHMSADQFQREFSCIAE